MQKALFYQSRGRWASRLRLESHGSRLFGDPKAWFSTWLHGKAVAVSKKEFYDVFTSLQNSIYIS